MTDLRERFSPSLLLCCYCTCTAVDVVGRVSGGRGHLAAVAVCSCLGGVVVVVPFVLPSPCVCWSAVSDLGPSFQSLAACLQAVKKCMKMQKYLRSCFDCDIMDFILRMLTIIIARILFLLRILFERVTHEQFHSAWDFQFTVSPWEYFCISSLSLLLNCKF